MIKFRPKIPRNKYGITNDASPSLSSTSSSSLEGGGGSGGGSSTSVNATLWGNRFTGSELLNGTITQNVEISNDYDWWLSAYYNSVVNIGASTEIGTDNAFKHLIWLGPKTSTYHPLELYYTNQSSGLLCDEVKATKAHIDTITSKNSSKVTIDKATDVTGTLTAYGSINQIESDEYDENPINSNSVIPLSTSKFWLGTSSFQWAKAFIEELHSYNITNTEKITTKDLLVTGSAHFFELVIDKIRSTNGAFILSQATGFEVDDVVYNGTKSVTLYHKATDNNGKEITQDWLVGDFAYCQTFNAATGTSYDVSNKYYWCLVTEVASTPVNRTINGVSTPCWWIKISQEIGDFDFLDADVGDNIAQLGHYKQDTETLAEAKLRGGALYLSAVQGIDTALKAPFIAQYEGIMAEVIDFELSNYRKTYIANGDSKFDGNFMVEGKTAKEYIDSVVPSASEGTPYIGANGNWFIYNQTTKQYEDSGVSAKGTNGENAGGFDLVINEVTIVDEALEWTTQGIIVDGTTRNPIDVNQYTIQIRKNEDATYSENYAAGSSGFYHDDGETKYDSSGNLVEKITFGLFEDATGTLLCTKEYYLTDSAESYQLLPIKNSIYTTYDIETKTQPIDCTLYYQLMHIKGHTRNLVSSGVRIFIQPYGGSTTHQLSYDSTLGYWYLVKDGSKEKGHLLDDNTSTGYNTYHIVVEAPIDGVTTTACRDSIDVVVVPQTTFKVMDDKIASYVSSALGNYTTIEQTDSKISMSAGNIKDGLKNKTGIDIEQGLITLDSAKTTVKGTLEIDSKENADGIHLLDTEGNAAVQLRNTEIGTALSPVTSHPVVSAVTMPPQTGIYTYETNKYTICEKAASGTKITINKPTVYFTDYATNAEPSSKTKLGTQNAWTKVMVLYVNDIETTTISIDDESTEYSVPTNATIKMSVRATIPAPAYGDYYDWEADTHTKNIVISATLSIIRATTHTTAIGSDGIISTTSTSEYFKTTGKETQLFNHNEGIILNDDGLRQIGYCSEGSSAGLYYGGWRKRIQRLTTTGDKFLSSFLEYDVILLTNNTGSSPYFHLDCTPAIGHTLILKNLTGHSCKLKAASPYKWYKNGNTMATEQEKDLGYYTWELIYVGDYTWLLNVLNN